MGNVGHIQQNQEHVKVEETYLQQLSGGKQRKGKFNYFASFVPTDPELPLH